MSTRESPSRANFKLSHLVQSIVFFLLALNVVGLVYLVADSKRVFSSLAAARLARLLGSAESALAPAEEEGAEAVEASAAPGAPQPAPPGRALTMVGVAPIASTGACVALENFKSPIQVQSAKALLASSPLGQKSWMVSTPIAAVYLAGVEAANASESRKVAKHLAERGVEPLSVSAQFVGLAKSDSAASAIELALFSVGGLPGAKVSARQVSPASDKRSIVALPQTRLEIQFASALASRLPGVSLVPVPCPAIAGPLLATRS